MALFTRGEKESEAKQPELRDQQVILAYLEELYRLDRPLQLWELREDALPIGAKICDLTESDHRITLKLQRALPGTLAPKGRMQVAFALDGQRFLAELAFRGRGGYLEAHFELPTLVRHGERRNRARAKFGPRERARVTLLEDLFTGCGATGQLIDLSLEGIKVRLDRVISVREERTVPITPGLFQPGTHLALVRLQDLPQTPQIECAGRTCHIERTPSGTFLGIQLQGLGGMEQQWISQVLARRIPELTHNFPKRHRRSEEELIELAIRVQREAEEEEAAVLELGKPEPGTPAEAEAELQDGKPSRRLQLAKRGRRVLLLMHEDLDRAILAGTLQVDGYRLVAEARNYLEASMWLRTSPVSLILVDQHLGHHTGLQMVEKLRKQGLGADVPVVLLADQPDVRLKLAARAARIAHVQSKPIDFDGELRGVLHGILLA